MLFHHVKFRNIVFQWRRPNCVPEESLQSRDAANADTYALPANRDSVFGSSTMSQSPKFDDVNMGVADFSQHMAPSQCQVEGEGRQESHVCAEKSTVTLRDIELLQQLFLRMRCSKNKFHNPVDLLRHFNMETNAQQDVVEFLNLFVHHFESIYQSSSHLPVDVRSSLRDTMFGQRKYVTTCLSCQTTMERIEEFLELSVWLPTAPQSVTTQAANKRKEKATETSQPPPHFAKYPVNSGVVSRKDKSPLSHERFQQCMAQPSGTHRSSQSLNNSAASATKRSSFGANPECISNSVSNAITPPSSSPYEKSPVSADKYPLTASLPASILVPFLTKILRAPLFPDRSDASRHAVFVPHNPHADAVCLSTLVSSLFHEEYLDRENTYSCRHCEELGKGRAQTAIRRVELLQLPDILFIQLMRFGYNVRTNVRRKLTTKVLIPHFLDFTAMRDEHERTDSAFSSIGSSNSPKEMQFAPASERRLYELSGLIFHKGQSANSGHYTCDVWDEERMCWWRLDDRQVEPLHPEISTRDGVCAGRDKYYEKAGKSVSSILAALRQQVPDLDTTPFQSISSPSSSPNNSANTAIFDDRMPVLDPGSTFPMPYRIPSDIEDCGSTKGHSTTPSTTPAQSDSRLSYRDYCQRRIHPLCSQKEPSTRVYAAVYVPVDTDRLDRWTDAKLASIEELLQTHLRDAQGHVSESVKNVLLGQAEESDSVEKLSLLHRGGEAIGKAPNKLRFRVGQTNPMASQEPSGTAISVGNEEILDRSLVIVSQTSSEHPKSTPSSQAEIPLTDGAADHQAEAPTEDSSSDESEAEEASQSHMEIRSQDLFHVSQEPVIASTLEPSPLSRNAASMKIVHHRKPLVLHPTKSKAAAPSTRKSEPSVDDKQVVIELDLNSESDGDSAIWEVMDVGDALVRHGEERNEQKTSEPSNSAIGAEREELSLEKAPTNSPSRVNNFQLPPNFYPISLQDVTRYLGMAIKNHPIPPLSDADACGMVDASTVNRGAILTADGSDQSDISSSVPGNDTAPIVATNRKRVPLSPQLRHILDTIRSENEVVRGLVREQIFRYHRMYLEVLSRRFLCTVFTTPGYQNVQTRILPQQLLNASLVFASVQSDAFSIEALSNDKMARDRHFYFPTKMVEEWAEGSDLARSWESKTDMEQRLQLLSRLSNRGSTPLSKIITEPLPVVRDKPCPCIPFPQSKEVVPFASTPFLALDPLYTPSLTQVDPILFRVIVEDLALSRSEWTETAEKGTTAKASAPDIEQPRISDRSSPRGGNSPTSTDSILDPCSIVLTYLSQSEHFEDLETKRQRTYRQLMVLFHLPKLDSAPGATIPQPDAPSDEEGFGEELSQADTGDGATALRSQVCDINQAHTQFFQKFASRIPSFLVNFEINNGTSGKDAKSISSQPNGQATFLAYYPSYMWHEDLIYFLSWLLVVDYDSKSMRQHRSQFLDESPRAVLRYSIFIALQVFLFRTGIVPSYEELSARSCAEQLTEEGSRLLQQQLARADGFLKRFQRLDNKSNRSHAFPSSQKPSLSPADVSNTQLLVVNTENVPDFTLVQSDAALPRYTELMSNYLERGLLFSVMQSLYSSLAALSGHHVHSIFDVFDGATTVETPPRQDSSDSQVVNTLQESAHMPVNSLYASLDKQLLSSPLSQQTPDVLIALSHGILAILETRSSSNTCEPSGLPNEFLEASSARHFSGSPMLFRKCSSTLEDRRICSEVRSALKDWSVVRDKLHVVLHHSLISELHGIKYIDGSKTRQGITGSQSTPDILSKGSNSTNQVQITATGGDNDTILIVEYQDSLPEEHAGDYFALRKVPSSQEVFDAILSIQQEEVSILKRSSSLLEKYFTYFSATISGIVVAKATSQERIIDADATTGEAKASTRTESPTSASMAWYENDFEQLFSNILRQLTLHGDVAVKGHNSQDARVSTPVNPRARYLLHRLDYLATILGIRCAQELSQAFSGENSGLSFEEWPLPSESLRTSRKIIPLQIDGLVSLSESLLEEIDSSPEKFLTLLRRCAHFHMWNIIKESLEQDPMQERKAKMILDVLLSLPMFPFLYGLLFPTVYTQAARQFIDCPREKSSDNELTMSPRSLNDTLICPHHGSNFSLPDVVPVSKLTFSIAELLWKGKPFIASSVSEIPGKVDNDATDVIVHVPSSLDVSSSSSVMEFVDSRDATSGQATFSADDIEGYLSGTHIDCLRCVECISSMEAQREKRKWYLQRVKQLAEHDAQALGPLLGVPSDSSLESFLSHMSNWLVNHSNPPELMEYVHVRAKSIFPRSVSLLRNQDRSKQSVQQHPMPSDNQILATSSETYFLCSYLWVQTWREKVLDPDDAPFNGVQESNRDGTGALCSPTTRKQFPEPHLLDASQLLCPCNVHMSKSEFRQDRRTAAEISKPKLLLPLPILQFLHSISPLSLFVSSEMDDASSAQLLDQFNQRSRILCIESDELTHSLEGLPYFAQHDPGFPKTTRKQSQIVGRDHTSLLAASKGPQSLSEQVKSQAAESNADSSANQSAENAESDHSGVEKSIIALSQAELGSIRHFLRFEIQELAPMADSSPTQSPQTTPIFMPRLWILDSNVSGSMRSSQIDADNSVSDINRLSTLGFGKGFHQAGVIDFACVMKNSLISDPRDPIPSTQTSDTSAFPLTPAEPNEVVYIDSEPEAMEVGDLDAATTNSELGHAAISAAHKSGSRIGEDGAGIEHSASADADEEPAKYVVLKSPHLESDMPAFLSSATSPVRWGLSHPICAKCTLEALHAKWKEKVNFPLTSITVQVYRGVPTVPLSCIRLPHTIPGLKDATKEASASRKSPLRRGDGGAFEATNAGASANTSVTSAGKRQRRALYSPSIHDPYRRVYSTSHHPDSIIDLEEEIALAESFGHFSQGTFSSDHYPLSDSGATPAFSSGSELEDDQEAKDEDWDASQKSKAGKRKPAQRKTTPSTADSRGKRKAAKSVGSSKKTPKDSPASAKKPTSASSCSLVTTLQIPASGQSTLQAIHDTIIDTTRDEKYLYAQFFYPTTTMNIPMTCKLSEIGFFPEDILILILTDVDVDGLEHEAESDVQNASSTTKGPSAKGETSPRPSKRARGRQRPAERGFVSSRFVGSSRQQADSSPSTQRDEVEMVDISLLIDDSVDLT